MERLTKRDTDGQAMMDCEKCKSDWTGKHGKPMADCIRIVHIGKARSANWMWRQEKMDELKPCPFCGGEAAFLGTTCTIKCKQCGGAFIAANPVMTRMETAAAWNRRVNDG